MTVHHLVISLLLTCITILSWIQSNKLKLNTQNRDVACRLINAFQFGQLRVCRSINFVELTFPFRAPLRSPEYILAKHRQRNNTPVVCHIAFHAFTRITSICPFLSSSSTAKLVSFTIMSRLDYCCKLLSQVYPMHKSHAYRPTSRGMS